MVAINNHTEYSAQVCEFVNSDQPTSIDAWVRVTDLREMGRDIPLTRSSTVADSPNIFTDTTIRSHPTIAFTPRDDVLSSLTEMYHTLFVDNTIEIEVFDSGLGIFVRRRLLESDVVISGSTLTTTYYDVINTSNNTKMTSNDVDVYILPRVKRMFINDNTPAKYAKMITNITVGERVYQFINFAAISKKNVYAFYDFDICRGAIHFTKDGLGVAHFSDAMVSCINTGYAIVGFHTHDERLTKYISRGLGVIIVAGCRVVPIDKYYGAISSGGYCVRGFNAVRNAHCRTCDQFHLDNRDKIHVYQSVCKKCLAEHDFKIISVIDMANKDVFDGSDEHASIEASSIMVPEGYELWFCGKKNSYHIIAPVNQRDSDFGKMLITAGGLVKYPCQSHKITLPIINITKMQPVARSTLLAFLGLNEDRLIKGTYAVRHRKYALNMSINDPVFDDIRLILSKCIDKVVYKARAFMATPQDGDVLDLCLKISVYVPFNSLGVLDMVVPMMCDMADMKYLAKGYMPFVTRRRYKRFGDWAKSVTHRKKTKAAVVTAEMTADDIKANIKQKATKDAESILDEQDSAMFHTIEGIEQYPDSDEE